MIRILKFEPPGMMFNREIICPTCCRSTKFMTLSPLICVCGNLFIDAFELEDEVSVRIKYSIDGDFYA